MIRKSFIYKFKCSDFLISKYLNFHMKVTIRLLGHLNGHSCVLFHDIYDDSIFD